MNQTAAINTKPAMCQLSSRRTSAPSSRKQVSWERPRIAKSVSFSHIEASPANNDSSVPQNLDTSTRSDPGQDRQCIYDSDLKETLWWSRDELEKNQLEHKREANEFQKEIGDFSEDVVKLYKDCLTFSISQVLRSPKAKKVIESSPKIRGLENRLCEKAFSRIRSQHAKVLLSATEDASDDELRKKSIQISRSSATFARLLAHSDALAAQI